MDQMMKIQIKDHIRSILTLCVENVFSECVLVPRVFPFSLSLIEDSH